MNYGTHQKFAKATELPHRLVYTPLVLLSSHDPLFLAKPNSATALFSVSCARFHFTYVISPLFATLTEIAGV